MAGIKKDVLVVLLASHKLARMHAGYVPENFFDNVICRPVAPDPGYTMEDAIAYVKNVYKTRHNMLIAAKNYGLVAGD